MKHSETTVRSIPLTDPLYNAARKKAKENGLSFSAWVRTLIIREMEPKK